MNTTNTQVSQTVNENRGTHRFDQGSVFSVLLKTAAPIVVLMFFNSMYAFVDSLMSSAFVDYGTVTNGVGEVVHLNGGTIVGLVLPFMGLLIAFEVMIAVGAGLAYTQSLAQGNYQEARDRHNEAMSMIIYIGIVVIIITSIIGLPYIVTVSGNWHHQVWGNHTKQMVLDGYSYMIILTIAFIPMQLQQSYTRILRAEGKGNVAALIPILTMPINIFFDWLFMSVLGTGIKGAGLATLIATSSGLVMMMTYVLFQGMNDKLVLKLRAPAMILNKEVYTVILIFAMGSFLRRVFDSSAMIMLSVYVGNIRVASDSIISVPDWQGSWTVMTRSINMGAQLSLGVAQAMSMLISYYTNSKQKDKIDKTIKLGATSMVMCSLSTFVLLMFMQGILFNAYAPNGAFGWEFGNQISDAFMLALVFSIPLSLQPMPVMFYAGTKDPKSTFYHSLTFNAILLAFATLGSTINHITLAPLYLFGFITVGGIIGFIVVTIMFAIRYKQITVN